MVKCYILSCDGVACVFLSGLVGSEQAWRAKGSEFESGSGKKKKKKRGFFSLSYYCLLISKDGCEKGRVTPRSWT